MQATHEKGTASAVPFFALVERTVVSTRQKHAMKKDILVPLQPGTIRPQRDNQFFQKKHKAPATDINFVAMERNEAVYRIEVRSDDRLATRALKRAAKESGKSLRAFVRYTVTFDDPSTNPFLELAQDWAKRKGMSLAPREDAAA